MIRVLRCGVTGKAVSNRRMLEGLSRRQMLRLPLALLTPALARHAFAVNARPRTTAIGNFKTIYSDPRLREQFHLFLRNVFHLYPDDRFHRLIGSTTATYGSDQLIYEALLQHLDEIKPRAAALTYAVPALRKQKQEMARE